MNMRSSDRWALAGALAGVILAAWGLAGETAARVPAAPGPAAEHPAVRRLRAEKRLRHFLDKTDSEIAARLASEVGLRARVDPTSPSHRVVVQKNLTNWDFLEQLARRNGFQVWVDGREGVLHFQKAGAASPRR